MAALLGENQPSRRRGSRNEIPRLGQRSVVVRAHGL